MLKINGFYLSLLFHIFLLLLLSSQFSHKRSNDIVKINNKEPIKSFLYIPQKIARFSHSIEKTTNQTKEKIVNNKSSYKTPKKLKKQISSPLSTQPDKNIKTKTNSKLSNTKKIITKKRLIDQLKALNTITSNYPTYKKSSSVKSIFNPTPALVTKSKTRSELQKEHDKKLKVTNYGNGIAIKKNKNGNCSVTQDLSSVGIEGVSATQYFKCGKSEFDINFEQHMEKAMEKYK